MHLHDLLRDCISVSDESDHVNQSQESKLFASDIIKYVEYAYLKLVLVFITSGEELPPVELTCGIAPELVATQMGFCQTNSEMSSLMQPN